MKNESCVFRPKKLTTLVTAIFCLVCSMPQGGYCIPIEQLAIDLANFTHGEFINNQENFEKSLSDLGDTIRNSEDRLAVGRQFFQTFLNEINSQNGTNITMAEAIDYLRQNMGIIPFEYQALVYNSLDAFESGILPVINNDRITAETFYWPWEWNWFGLNKKDTAHEDSHQQRNQEPPVEHAIQHTQPDWKFILCFAGAVIGITTVAVLCPGAVGAASAGIAQAATAILGN